MNPKRKSRARQACKACNARRVKCNVVETQPCNNCKDQQIPCELRESLRGRHRRPNLSQALSSPSNTNNVGIGNHQQQELRPLASGSGPSLSPVPTVPTPEPAEQRLASIDRPSAPSREGHDIYNVPWEPSLPQPQTQQVPQDNQDHDGSEDDDTVFLGESTSIRCLHDTQPSPIASSTPDRGFVYRIPQGLNAEAVTSQWELERKQARLGLLQLEGAFSFPSKPAVESVLKAYFRWFHRCFAIVDEPDIWDQHYRDVIPPLLLQSMLFIGVMHCPEQDLKQVGLGSRQRAKVILYNRAKSLFDAEAEPKSLVVIQALFLMSFYRAGPLLQKNTRHWLAVAVSQAETRGLHRASRKEKDKTYHLRKRVWWSIYIRERECAAALGLPNRVRDEDCDVEALQEQDFQHAFDLSSSSFQAAESISYMVGMVELSRMLGQIVHRDFLPSKRLSAAEREELRITLADWKASLPACMQLAFDETNDGPGYLASMLHLAYNNLLILLYRSGCGNIHGSSGGAGGKIAIQAAVWNSTLIENMVTEDQMRHGQIHVITNVFNTLCIHTLQLRELRGGRRFVAEQRAKLCLVSLQELQRTWEFKNWILQLFFQYLDQPTAIRLRMEDETVEATTPHQQSEQQQDIHVAPGCSTGGDMLQVYNDIQTGQIQLSSGRFSDTTWPLDVGNVGQFLHTQIEDRLINGDGGAMDWYMADLFDASVPP